MKDDADATDFVNVFGRILTAAASIYFMTIAVLYLSGLTDLDTDKLIIVGLLVIVMKQVFYG